ncbi:MAG: hypothetical protein WD845_03535 [Pirellulales bacterium]
MKRSLLFAVVTMSMCVLATSASAGSKKKHDNDETQQSGNQSSHKFSQNFGLSLGRGNLGSISNMVSQFKKHKKDKPDSHETTPLDPGMGDGRVPVDPAEPVVPQGRPGYVWVDGHWERERAPKVPPLTSGNGNGGVTVTPTGGSGSQVLDQGQIIPPLSSGNGGGGVTVTSGNGGRVVRDHRKTVPTSSSANGGVLVTTTPGSTRGQAVTGSGLNPFGVIVDGLAKAGSTIAGGGSITGVAPSGQQVRDHRTTSANQPIVRDHR